MTQAPSGNDILGYTKGRSASFDGNPPITYEGEVLEEPSTVQQRDYDTDEPKFYDDGKPMWQVAVKLQTEDRDDDEDEGIRTVWLKGLQLQAVRAAMREAGVKAILPGGWLSITFYGTKETEPKPGQPKNKKRYPTKLYKATYTPPMSAAAKILAADDDDQETGAVKDVWLGSSDEAGKPQPSKNIREAAKHASSVLENLRTRNHRGEPQDAEPAF